jgi:hypothetical protein
MRFLIFLLFISSIASAQCNNSTSFPVNRAPCTFEITIEQLTAKELSFKCPELFNNESFRIENFNIKFESKPTINVKGNTLNAKSNILAKNLKVGDHVIIFRVKNIIINGNNSQEYNTLDIKIVEP